MEVVKHQPIKNQPIKHRHYWCSRNQCRNQFEIVDNCCRQNYDDGDENIIADMKKKAKMKKNNNKGEKKIVRFVQNIKELVSLISINHHIISNDFYYDSYFFLDTMVMKKTPKSGQNTGLLT